MVVSKTNGDPRNRPVDTAILRREEGFALRLLDLASSSMSRRSRALASLVGSMPTVIVDIRQISSFLAKHQSAVKLLPRRTNGKFMS
jgi:hypothetical protein